LAGLTQLKCETRIYNTYQELYQVLTGKIITDEGEIIDEETEEEAAERIAYLSTF
jgi:hypothetical protein